MQSGIEAGGTQLALKWGGTLRQHPPLSMLASVQLASAIYFSKMWSFYKPFWKAAAWNISEHRVILISPTQVFSLGWLNLADPHTTMY